MDSRNALDPEQQPAVKRRRLSPVSGHSFSQSPGPPQANTVSTEQPWQPHHHHNASLDVSGYCPTNQQGHFQWASNPTSNDSPQAWQTPLPTIALSTTSGSESLAQYQNQGHEHDLWQSSLNFQTSVSFQTGDWNYGEVSDTSHLSAGTSTAFRDVTSYGTPNTFDHFSRSPSVHVSPAQTPSYASSENDRTLFSPVNASHFHHQTQLDLPVYSHFQSLDLITTDTTVHGNSSSSVFHGSDTVNFIPGQSLGVECQASFHIDNTEVELNPNHGDWEIDDVLPDIRKEDLETVCFGKVIGIEATVDDRFPVKHLSTPIKFISPTEFISLDNGGAHHTGRVSKAREEMIKALLEAVDEGLEIQAFCNPKNTPGPPLAKGSSPHAGRRSVCTLSIFVFGTFSWFDDIGQFFQSHELYLQDPLDCDRRNLRYCNPHRLSWKDLDSSVYISDLAKGCVDGGITTLEQQRDVLEVFDANDHLAEAAQPRGIKTPLARHQKESLTFMIRRESKCVFDGSDAEIWEAIQGREGKAYLNRVSQEVQDQEPPQFQGGIIADPMGLGKTLSMISLIATDTERALRASQRHGLTPEYKTAPSLVVVPPSILDTWEEQFAEHAVPGEIRFRRHYGKDRLQSAGCLKDCEAVLTTYHTVSSEWRRASRTNDASHILFGTRWRRVILDEAHYIRNAKSNMAKSVCSLEADARWAVTGTPVQNSLSDLTSLLTFLRAYPYADNKRFDADIARRWKAGTAEGAEEAVKRLKCLARCLLLRRPKSTLQLPDRHDLLKPLEFSPEERAYYDRTKQEAEQGIKTALANGDETTGAFARALQQIEALRMICNLGLHYRRPSERKTAVQGLDEEAAAWADVAQENFNFQREFGLDEIRCQQCKTSVDEMDDGIEAVTTTSCLFSRCLRFTCSECVARAPRWQISCGHEPRCPSAAIHIDGSASETIFSPGHSDDTSPSSLPTKVQALVADIKGLDPAIKSVVFSSWRKTLDLTLHGLEQEGIQCVRFDGTVPQKERQGVVEQFRKDPNIRVMLLTLSCGAVGLNLTVASRAYLMEPHWNPTQEEQALARIHRMGQTRPVTTIRMHIKNSFEQNILDLQKDKTHLAGVILSQKNEKAGGEAGVRSLLRLRSLI